VEYWAEATYPGGNVRVVFGPGTLLVSPGTYARSLTQRIPATSPVGDYTYTMKVGTYPGEVLAEDAFTGTVTAAAGARNGEAGGEDVWRLYAADGTLLEAGSVLDLRPDAPEVAEAAATAAAEGLPSVPALHAPFPNPFGGHATVRYDVPAAGDVRVVAYELLGREVAGLAAGATEAGRFAVAFDARSLPSGVYLVRMTAGGFSQTQRVTLLH